MFSLQKRNSNYKPWHVSRCYDGNHFAICNCMKSKCCTLNLHNIIHQLHLNKGRRKELWHFHFIDSKNEIKKRKQNFPHWGQYKSAWSPLGFRLARRPLPGRLVVMNLNNCLKYKKDHPVQSPTRPVFCSSPGTDQLRTVWCRVCIVINGTERPERA